jgi:hypothetical protein
MTALLPAGRYLVVVLALMAAAAPTARAQSCTSPYPGTCTVAGTATITVAKVMAFQLSTSSTAAPAPSPDDYVQGHNETAGPVITLRANSPWSLSVSAGTPLWSAQSNGGAAPRVDKPAEDLLWTVTAGSGYVPLTTAGATVASGMQTNDATISLYYRILHAIETDAPGTYELDVVLTVVTP